MSTITILNNTTTQLPLQEAPDPGSEDLTFQAYQNLVLQNIDAAVAAAASEASGGPLYVNKWLANGQYYIQTANYDIWFTPATYHSVSATGSNIRRLEVSDRWTGDFYQYDGSIRYSGMALTSTLLSGSNITAMVASAEVSAGDFDSVLLRFDGSVTYDGSTSSGTITRYSETLLDAESGALMSVVIEANQGYSGDWLSSGAIIKYAESYVLGDATTAYSLTAQNVNLQTSQATMGGFSDQSRAGADTVQMLGTIGSRFEGLGGNDDIRGGSGNDVLVGGAGNDLLNGGNGDDVAEYRNAVSQYTVQRSGTKFIVAHKAGTEGTDTLTSMEHLVFADKSVNLGVGQVAATVAAADLQSIVELYAAFFNRVPDSDGMAFWLGQAAKGVSVSSIADHFYGAAVHYSSITGYSATMTNADFVNVIYHNVLGRPSADPGGLAFWTNALATGTQTRGTLVEAILDSAHTFKGDATYGYVANLLDNKYLVGKLFAVDMGLSFNTPEASIQKGMEIAQAITPTDTQAAISLIGVSAADIHLV